MNVAAVSNTSVSSRKLLKMHEAKYEPMDKVDAEKIMEEILGMKAGLNPDQQVSHTIIMLPHNDESCFHLMNASFCHIMMSFAAIMNHVAIMPSHECYNDALCWHHDALAISRMLHAAI